MYIETEEIFINEYRNPTKLMDQCFGNKNVILFFQIASWSEIIHLILFSLDFEYNIPYYNLHVFLVYIDHWVWLWCYFNIICSSLPKVLQRNVFSLWRSRRSVCISPSLRLTPQRIDSITQRFFHRLTGAGSCFCLCRSLGNWSLRLWIYQSNDGQWDVPTAFNRRQKMKRARLWHVY